VSYPHHHRCKTDPRQVRRYQCEAALRWRIGRWPGLHPRPFRPAHANEDPRLSTEEVTKRGKVFRQQRIGRWSYLPLLFIFILILVIPSRRFRLRGSVLPPHPCHHPGSTRGPSPLPPHPQPFTVDTIGLPPHHIRWSGDPHMALRVYLRSCARTHTH
jgi:hypothetical protein